MFRPLRPIRPVRVVRPVGAPLVRGLVVGGAYAAGRAAPAPGLSGELTRLGELAESGLLTPEEFSAAKAKLLG